MAGHSHCTAALECGHSSHAVSAHLLPRARLQVRAVHKGRFWVSELIGVVQLRKYRALRKRYGDASAGIAAREQAVEDAAMEDASRPAEAPQAGQSPELR